MVAQNVQVFPSPPPVADILNRFVALFQLDEAPNVHVLLQTLSTLLIFDQAKVLFVAENGFTLFSSFLATAEDPQLVKDLLAVYHSAVFNLQDAQRQSVYDVVAPSFAAVKPE
jgi:hypothetical protein